MSKYKNVDIEYILSGRRKIPHWLAGWVIKRITRVVITKDGAVIADWRSDA